MNISKRIASLILALLMVVTALPLTFIGATAAETQAVAATPGTAPAKLPNGKTYTGTPLIADSVDLVAKFMAGNSSGRNGQTNWPASAQRATYAMLQDGAEGVIFKIDTSNAAASTSNTLAFAFVIQLFFNDADVHGSSGNTYIAATPKMATAFSEGTTTANDKSTWYYSQDGASWNELVATGASNAASQVSIPVGKQVTYVYVPMSSFWTKCGETFLKTGAHDKTENIVNWLDARDMIKDDYYLGGFNAYSSTADGSVAVDENVSITEWRLVDHVQAVADMVTVPMTTADTPEHVAGPYWSNKYYRPEAHAAARTAKGMMVEIDTSHVPAGDDQLGIGILLGNYFISSSKHACNFGGAKAADWSSVLYWSEDGVNWTTVDSTATQSTYLPKSRAKAYVYVPFESFWTRYTEAAMSGNSAHRATIVDMKDALAAYGASYLLSYFGVYYNDGASAANAGAKFSNWCFVYEEGAFESDKAPDKLPGGDYYTTEYMFTDSSALVNKATYNGTNWIDEAGRKVSSVAHLNNASGIMVKVDSSMIPAGTDALAFRMIFEVNVGSTGWVHLGTGIGGAKWYGYSTAAATTYSTWYYSNDGVSWAAISSTASDLPVTAYRGEGYLYMPFSEMYFDASFAEIQTGTRDTTAAPASYNEVKAAGYTIKNTSNDAAGNCRVRFNYASNSMADAALTDWKFVYVSDTAPEAEEEVQLPSMSQDLTVSMMNINDASGRPNWQTGFTTSSEIALKNADGVVFELDTSASTDYSPAQLTFFLSVQAKNCPSGANAYLYANIGRAKDYGNATYDKSATSSWYWSVDGENWKEIVGGYNSQRTSIPNNRGKSYVYVPFDSFVSRYSVEHLTGVDATPDNTKPAATYAEYMAAVGDAYDLCTAGSLITWWGDAPTGTSATATTTNWSFVYMNEDKSVKDSAPDTFPGTNEKYATQPMLNDAYPAYDDSLSGQWIGAIETPGLTDLFMDAKGIVFKWDATNANYVNDNMKFSFTMVATTQGGVSTYVCAHVAMAKAYGDIDGTGKTSTWYVSNDGMNWTPVTDTATGSGATLINRYRGVSYVYIPMEALYMRHGATYLRGGANVKSDPVLSFAEATKLVGGWKKIGGNAAFWFSGAAGATASDFQLVFDSAKALKSASVTLTNSLAYNVYATVPENATDVKMTFNFAGKNTVVAGELMENGTTRYSLKGIYPQHIGQTITATWTATVDGKTVVETHSGSIEKYARELINGGIYQAKWTELATALLHYGAAAQAVDTESTGEAVNKNVAASILPMNLKNVPATYSNGNKNIWRSVALTLNSDLYLKVGVNAPAGVDKVQYTVNGRTGVLKISGGYVWIPVAAHEMMDDIVVKCVSGSTVTGDASMTISPMYYLKKINVGNDAKMAALIQAIANYAGEAIAVAEKRTGAYATGVETLAEIQLEEDNGGGLAEVIKLKDGRFIIIDGGVAGTNNSHTSRLYDYLMAQNNYQKPVIAAWIFTHYDGDHTYNGFNILKYHRFKVEVQEVIYTFQTDASVFQKSDGTFADDHAKSAHSIVAPQNTAFAEIQRLNVNTKFTEMKTGSKFTIGGVTLDVLIAADTATVTSSNTHNEWSSAIKFTFSSGKTFMSFGDCTPERLQWMYNKYGSALKSDVMQATHHGLVGGDKTTYQTVNPSVVLIPKTEEALRAHSSGLYWGGTVEKDYNKWLRTRSTAAANDAIYFHDQTTIINMSNLSATTWAQ